MLSKTAIKILKTSHIAFSAITLGGITNIFIALLIKQYNNALFIDPMIDQLLFKLNNWVIFYSFMGVILTALIFSLFTHRGFIKYDWVIIKWISLLLIAIFYIWFFIPSLNGMASLSDSRLMFSEGRADYFKLLDQSILWSGVIMLIMIFIFFISVFKPFGKRDRDLFKNIRTARIVIVPLVFVGLLFFLYNAYQLSQLRNMEIADIRVRNLKTGTYKGTFTGGGGFYNVTIEIENKKIQFIDYYTNRKSKYTKFAQPTIDRIIDKNNVNIDAITGATTTSKCIMKAVENALQ